MMAERYEDICKSLKIGWWSVNFQTKIIQIDNYIATLLNLPSSQLSIAEFLGYVMHDEREAIGIALDTYPQTQTFDFSTNIRINFRYHLIEATLDAPQVVNGSVAGGEGSIRIKSGDSSSTDNIRMQDDDTRTTAEQKDLETQFREQNQRIAMACKVGMVYPWTWYVTEKSAEFTIFENEKVIRKGIYFDGFAETLHPDDKPVYYYELGLFAENKIQALQLQYRSDFFAGNLRWYEMVGEVFERDENGKCIKAVGIVHDITDEKQKEEELTRNEMQLIREKVRAEEAVLERKIVLDNLTTALIFINKDYVVQWESTKALGPLFKDKAYRPGTICHKTVFKSESPCKDCALTEMFACRKPVSHLYQEHGVVVEITANPVLSERGEFMGGVLKIENVTKRVQQENEIRKLNNVMETILNNIPVYLFVKDPNDDFRYLYWNKAMADNTKIPAENVLGKTDDEAFPSQTDAVKFRNDDLRLLKKGHKTTILEEYLTAEGEMRIANTLKTLIPSEDELPWILGISWDVTDIKRAEKELIIAKEKAEESNLLKSAFLANMSHEIRTPLNAIVGFSDLLVESEDVEEKQEYIEIIKKNNELLLQLISDILDLSKIEAQSLEFIYEQVDVNTLCSGIVAASNLRTDAKVPVVFDEYAGSCRIYSDRNRVNQVISNLVNNALKFTSAGDIRVGYHMLNDDTIKFYVRDTGTGIPAGKLGSIFERFIKLNHFVQGTGLGLSICKSIVEQLNGEIGVESEEGKGSYFWFTLPYDRKLNEIIAEPEQQSVSIPVEVEQIKEEDRLRTILIAEDIDSNYLLLQSVLKKQYNLIRAYNGIEAIKLFKDHRPDMILMDIKMPEMNGLEATREIRKTDKLIPIIALTAFAFDSDIQKAMVAGCDDFLTKPISVPQLKETISRTLQQCNKYTKTN